MTSTLPYDAANFERDVHELSIVEILELCNGQISFSREQRRHKALAVYRVATAAPLHVRISLQMAGRQKRERKARAREATRERNLQRDRDWHQGRRRQSEPQISSAEEPWDTTRFLQLPSSQQLKNCYSRFYNATSNRALRRSTCAVCARNRLVSEVGETRFRLDKIPNRHRLCPRTPHPAHELTNGMLLEQTGLRHNEDNGATYAVLCNQCQESLKKNGSNLPPKLSLANNLWIGRVPDELQGLTFPEQLLLAQLYPRVFVFKLFPKKMNGVRSIASLQSGLRGNVSTYALNPDAIADMISGNLMPHPPRILASVIAITFVGLGSLPREWLRSLFRVRRQVLRKALVWLKNNNRHYEHIEINEHTLSQLPEDDVPEEIVSILQHSDDVGSIDENAGGYVPNDDEEDEADGDPSLVDNHSMCSRWYSPSEYADNLCKMNNPMSFRYRYRVRSIPICATSMRMI